MNDPRKLNKIASADQRYKTDAYIFVLEALQFTRKRINAESHVTGQQLLDGIKNLAQEKYGLMAKMVFEHWGIAETIDFGNIVINMVNAGILSKTPEDKLEDFKDVYNFDDVFVKEYQVEFDKRQHKHRSTKLKH
jgi:uncharacterized repeat protein (TIGR04138 family)